MTIVLFSSFSAPRGSWGAPKNDDYFVLLSLATHGITKSTKNDDNFVLLILAPPAPPEPCPKT